MTHIIKHITMPTKRKKNVCIPNIVFDLMHKCVSGVIVPKN